MDEMFRALNFDLFLGENPLTVPGNGVYCVQPSATKALQKL
jgi:hypothetical protein